MNETEEEISEISDCKDEIRKKFQQSNYEQKSLLKAIASNKCESTHANCDHQYLTENIERCQNFTDDNKFSELIVYKDESLTYFVNETQNEQYIIKDFIGKGEYGQVYDAIDVNNSGKHVAIKIIRNLPNYERQGLKEITIMKALSEAKDKESSRIVQMIDFFKFKHHIVIIFELLDISLMELIENTGFTGFPFHEISKISLQLINGLKSAKSANIIHADLKPENILFEKKNSMAVKVIDWGSAMFLNEQPPSYYQSRFYRAPEIILGQISNYNEIDIWSLGCIIAELFIGLPIFPGSSNYDQLFKILNLLGIPNGDLRKKMIFESQFLKEGIYGPTLKTKEEYEIDSKECIPEPRQFLDISSFDIFEELYENSELRTTAEFFKLHSFIEALEKILVLDPCSRINLSDILELEFFKNSMVNEDLFETSEFIKCSKKWEAHKIEICNNDELKKEFNSGKYQVKKKLKISKPFAPCPDIVSKNITSNNASKLTE